MQKRTCYSLTHVFFQDATDYDFGRETLKLNNNIPYPISLSVQARIKS